MDDSNIIDVNGKTDEQLQSLRQLTLVVYCLYAASWLLGGVPAIVAIVVNHIKREDVQGTLYESHFTWQIRTFWWFLAWCLLGGLTIFIGVGFVVLGAAAIWGIYRIVKGLLFWNDRKPMPV
jgi:uncharacterized membrane protein